MGGKRLSFKQQQLKLIAQRVRLQGQRRLTGKGTADDLGGPAGSTRAKRPACGLWAWSEKLYVPVDLKTKVEFMRLARENGMSQAELGLAVIVALVKDEKWVKRAAASYQNNRDKIYGTKRT